MNSALRHRRVVAAALLAVLIATPFSLRAEDLYKRGNWAALASDRMAERVGDSLTIVISETSQASNSAQTDVKKKRGLSGLISGGNSVNSGQISLSGRYDGSRQTDRAGTMVAQISVVVDEVLPNGDLHVSGQQVININGEHTNIKLKGRVRRADIEAGNTVLSTRLADAAIDYDGTGFVNRHTKSRIATRILNWLGLS
jgi:flagellar L-ring protein FlgH